MGASSSAHSSRSPQCRIGQGRRPRRRCSSTAAQFNSCSDLSGCVGEVTAAATVSRFLPGWCARMTCAQRAAAWDHSRLENILVTPLERAQIWSVMRRVRVTLPLHCRYVTVTLPLHHRYIMVTVPLHCRYIAVTLPLHYRYITVTSALHHRYITVTLLVETAAALSTTAAPHGGAPRPSLPQPKGQGASPLVLPVLPCAPVGWMPQ